LYDRVLGYWLCAVRYFVGLSWGVVEECPCVQRHVEMQLIRGAMVGHKGRLRDCLDNWWYISSQRAVGDVIGKVEGVDGLLMFRAYRKLCLIDCDGM